MKQLKSEDNIALNAKKLSKNSLARSRFLSIIKNDKGMNLIEVMVTAIIGVIVSLGIASVFIFAMEQFTILVEQNTAEESVLMTTYNLRNYLSQGVDVYALSVVNTANITGMLPAGGGAVDYNFDLLTAQPTGGAVVAAPDSGEFARFAMFNREAGSYNTGTGSMPNGGSQMKPTGIFVKDTDVNGISPDAQSGGVIFDFNTDSGVMVPTASDLWYSRLHNLRVQRMPAGGDCPGGYAIEMVRVSDGTLLKCAPVGGIGGLLHKVKTVTVEVSFRYFKSATKGDWNFRAPIGGPATAPYRDIVQTVKINFKNNVLTTESLTGAAGAEERVHGSLYFYDYVMPSINAN